MKQRAKEKIDTIAACARKTGGNTAEPPTLSTAEQVISEHGDGHETHGIPGAIDSDDLHERRPSEPAAAGSSSSSSTFGEVLEGSTISRRSTKRKSCSDATLQSNLEVDTKRLNLEICKLELEIKKIDAETDKIRLETLYLSKKNLKCDLKICLLKQKLMADHGFVFVEE